MTLSLSKLSFIPDLLLKFLTICFWLTFPLTIGVSIGGDPYFFGAFLPYSQVVFPLGAIIICLVFFLKVGGKDFEINFRQVTFFLFFIILHLSLAIFSQDSLTSTTNLVLWVIAFMVCPVGKVFSLQDKDYQSAAWIGCSVGLVLYYFYPNLISITVLGLGGVWVWIESLRYPHLSRLWLMSILFWAVLWFTHQLLFLILSLLLWFGIKIWVARNQQTFSFLQWILGLVILAGLIMSELNFSFWDVSMLQEILPLWKQNISTILSGIGDRQFYHYFSDPQRLSFLPGDWQLPSSDAVLTLLEKGVLGLLAQLLLISFPLWMKENKAPMRFFILLIPFLFSSQIWNEPSGIILIGVILFSD